jgi:hypothetical protein
MSDNSWYEKGELPPVGCHVKLNCASCTCDYVEKMHGKKAEILMHRTSSTGHPVAVFCIIDDEGFNSYHALTNNDNFRPIKTERELAIDAAIKATKETVFVEESVAKVAGILFDAGLLRSKNES